MKARFVVAMLAIAIFCVSALAQENTADGWMKKGYELMGNGSYEEATKAMQKAVELDPKNATLWDAKAQSLAFAVSFSGNLSEYSESLKAQDKAIELDPKNSTLLVHKGFLIANLADISEPENKSMYEDAIKEFDKAIKLDPQNKDAWNWKGMVLDSRLNRYDEALIAYDKAIEIGGTNASDKALLSRAWGGKGYDMAKLGKYNESFEAFDNATTLNPQNAAFIWYVNATAVNASGMYGEAVKAYDKAIELSKENITAAQAYEGKGMALSKLGKYDDAVIAYGKAIELYTLEPMGARAWFKKGIALEALDRQAEADAAFAKAKELGYETSAKSQTKTSSASVKMLAITAIRTANKDKSVEITNSLTKAQSLKGWTLNINDGRNQSTALPDFTLGPDKRINIHFGKGISNGTDIFLNSAVILNDTAGNVTLKNETGKSMASLEYRVEPDGSVTGLMVAEGEFTYPRSGSNEVKMVVREAGTGPYVTERTEYEPEAVRSNNSSAAEENTADTANTTDVADTADDWFKQGRELIGNGSKEEGMQALDKALQLYNNSIRQNPKDTDALLGKAGVLTMIEFSKSGPMLNGSAPLAAYDDVLKIDPENFDALIGKGFLLFEMGFTQKDRYNESLNTLDRALQIDPGDPLAWNFKGSVLMSMGKHNESLEAYDRAIENIGSFKVRVFPGPDNKTEELSGLWLSRGVTLQLTGRIDDSLKAFNESIRIDPGNYDAWMFKGQSLDRMGRYNDSANAFENASKALQPVPRASVSSIAYAWISKADVLMKSGRYKEAKAIYDKTVELNYSANDSIDTFYLASAWQGEGRVLAKLGEYNKSLNAFNKSIVLGSSNAFEAWIAEGDTLRDMGQYNETLKAYDKAIETSPSNYSKIKAWIGKGEAFDKMSRHDEAAAAYREAINDCDESLKLYSLDGEVWYYKGTALKALGRQAEADAANARAKELGYNG